MRVGLLGLVFGAFYMVSGSIWLPIIRDKRDTIRQCTGGHVAAALLMKAHKAKASAKCSALLILHPILQPLHGPVGREPRSVFVQLGQHTL